MCAVCGRVVRGYLGGCQVPDLTRIGKEAAMSYRAPQRARTAGLSFPCGLGAHPQRSCRSNGAPVFCHSEGAQRPKNLRVPQLAVVAYREEHKQVGGPAEGFSYLIRCSSSLREE